MEIGPYLALTAAEFATMAPFPAKTAWIGCPFSSLGAELASLPPALPAGSLLILTDQHPPGVLDSYRMANAIRLSVEKLNCTGVVLDFQRPGLRVLSDLAALLSASLPCPVAVSEKYAEGLGCPIFLSPCPHHLRLKEHIAPWAGREIWLDLAADAQVMTLTKEGCTISPLPLGAVTEGGYGDDSLHCHYRTETGDDFARFTLWRTRDDLEGLARDAKELGVKAMVGLWQEWNTDK